MKRITTRVEFEFNSAWSQWVINFHTENGWSAQITCNTYKELCDWLLSSTEWHQKRYHEADEKAAEEWRQRNTARLAARAQQA